MKIQSKSQVKSTDTYKNEIKQIAPFIDVLEEYQGAHIKIKHYCNKHNVEWMAYPTNVIRGHFCKECGKDKNSEKFKFTHEYYLQRLSKVNPFILPLEKYDGINNSIYHKCLICGYQWSTSPRSLIDNKTGCPNCLWKKLRKLKSYTKEQYINIISINNPDIELIGDYINSQFLTKHKCKICGNIWDVFPENIIKGHGCRKCADKQLSINMTKTHEEFMLDFINKNSSSNSIEIVSKYTGAKNSIKCKCLLCNNEWSALPDNLLSKDSGCSICSVKSKGEKIICDLLNQYNISFIPQMTFSNLRGHNNGLLSYDFYLPEYNKLIEFQGKQHEEPVEYFGGSDKYKIQKEHDLLKNKYAQENNIDLIEIWYYDMNNIDKILKEKLKLECVETAG